jgi:hypothetical protein
MSRARLIPHNPYNHDEYDEHHEHESDDDEIHPEDTQDTLGEHHHDHHHAYHHHHFETLGGEQMPVFHRVPNIKPHHFHLVNIPDKNGVMTNFRIIHEGWKHVDVIPSNRWAHLYNAPDIEEVPHFEPSQVTAPKPVSQRIAAEEKHPDVPPPSYADSQNRFRIFSQNVLPPMIVRNDREEEVSCCACRIS